MFSLPAKSVVQLHNNFPRWRLMVLLRLATIFISLATILCFVVVLSANTTRTSTLLNWQWGEQYLEYSAFLPVGIIWDEPNEESTLTDHRGQCAFSIVWGLGTLLYLAFVMNPISPTANFGVDLAILVFNVLPIVFCVSVSGPMQSSQDGLTPPSEKLDGAWEIAGVIGSSVLE